MTLDGIEYFIRWVGGVMGLATLAFALWQGVWRGLQQHPGRTTGNARKVLRIPLTFILGLLWIGVCVILWHPVPFSTSTPVRIAILMAGTLQFILGFAFHFLGARTPGTMYNRPKSLRVQ